MHNLEVSQGSDGLEFKKTGRHLIDPDSTLLTVKGMASEDCIVLTVPGGSDVGVILTCKPHKVPKSVVENFIQYAACQNYHFTNVRENPINYATTCEEVLQQDPLTDLNKIAGRWTLVAKAFSSPRSPEADENHIHGWIEITVHHRNNITITRSPTTTDVAGIEEGEYKAPEKWISKFTDEGTLLINVYETCPDELLLQASLLGTSKSILFLFSKSGTIQALEKKTFKNQALCSLHPYVSGIPAEKHKELNALTCSKIFHREPYEDRREISGRWILVAKATSYERCPCMLPDEVDGWIEFSLHGDQANVTRSPDSVDMEEVPDEHDYHNGVNWMSLNRDDRIVTLTPYKTCQRDLLILHLVKLLKPPTRTTVMLLSRTGTAPAHIKEKFKARAQCDGLRNVYGIPDDQ
nr:uncharacterized protein LOC117346088 isoform X2 [Geotrypetes seraphini]